MKNYVYIYLDPRKPGIFSYEEYTFNYEPFYVGKGKGYRLSEHLSYKNHYNSFLGRKINKIRKTGNKPIIIKLFENLTKEDAIKKEIELISKIKRSSSGPLTNLTDGGEGLLGVNEEIRNKITKSLIKAWENPNSGFNSIERSKKIIDSLKIYWSNPDNHNNPERKIKQRNARKGKPGYWRNKRRGAHTKEWNENIGRSLKGQTSWNKGLTAKTDERVKKNGENIRKARKGKNQEKDVEKFQ